MSLIEESHKKSHRDPAKRILFGILNDFTERKGLSGEWRRIDEDIQEEILETWLEIIDKELIDS